MRTAAWIGIGGFFGSIARFTVSRLMSGVSESLPWGTFAVNATGSFALGVLVGMWMGRATGDPDLRIGLTVGFLGAYTTFSTFALESVRLAEHSPRLALVNVIASVAVGMLAVLSGLALGRSL